MRRVSHSEIPEISGICSECTPDVPPRYIDTGFQYKLPADFEFLNSRIRTRQNQAEYLKYRCQNRTGAAIVKIEFSKLSEFPEAADPPVNRSYSILESCKIL